MKKNKTQSKFPAAFAITVCVIFLFWLFSNFTIKTTHTVIPSDKVKNTITFALISDLHGIQFGRSNTTLISAIKSENPDAVLVTGDMMTRSRKDDEDVAVELMTELAKSYPVYFVSGEHDYMVDYLRRLESGGVDVLMFTDDESHGVATYGEDYITIGETRVYICGIGYRSNSYKISDCLSLPDDAYTVLLTHVPQIERIEDFGADLTVCGDTHGGIVQLIGPVYCDGKWFPEVLGDDQVYDRGLFKYDENKSIYITAGLGAYPVPFRLNNRPELSIIAIEPTQ